MSVAAHHVAPTPGQDEADRPPAPVTPLRAAAARRPRVAVVGLGYVGLPTALALLEAGSDVIGIDTSARRRAAIARGAVDLLPADLDRLRRHTGTDRWVVTAFASALQQADVVLVCVPTPVDEHRVPDLSALRATCATVVAEARPGQLLVLTSTTYVGTTRDLLVVPLAERDLVAGRDVSVAFAPERIDPGNSDFPVERTPRVVGGATPQCLERAVRFLARTAPLVHRVSSCEAAEMAKLHENTFRAVNIAYVNEVADICDELGLDVTEVIDAAASKPYGFLPFRPGPGVGGHCVPCDPHYLLWQLRARRVQAPVVETAMRAVAARPGHVVRRVQEALAEARVLVVGVAYKPGVADLRESPALEVLGALSDRGVHVGFTDPLVDTVVLPGRTLHAEPEVHAWEWDLALVHTRHPGVDVAALLGGLATVDATFGAGRP